MKLVNRLMILSNRKPNLNNYQYAESTVAVPSIVSRYNCVQSFGAAMKTKHDNIFVEVTSCFAQSTIVYSF